MDKEHKKIKNGFSIKLKKWDNTIIIEKDNKIIKKQEFKDYIKAYIVFKAL